MSLSGETAQEPSVITTALIVVSVIFPMLSGLCIYLRFLARRKRMVSWQADDMWVVIAWITSLPLSILVWVYAAKSGVNYFNVDPLTGTEASLEMVWLSSCLLELPLTSVKIAVLLFYKRIFTTPVFKICTYIAIGFIAIWGSLFTILLVLDIDPVRFPFSEDQLRFDDSSLGLAQVGSSIVLDYLVLCFPLPVISRLNLCLERKIAVGFIFWLGAFCGVAAIVRMVLLNESIRAVVASNGLEAVHNQSKQYIFMLVEPNCSIIAACLPCYGPLLPSGHAAESLVRSVRGFLGSPSTLPDNSQNHRWFGTPRGFSKTPSAVESQTELQETTLSPYGAHQGHQDVSCVGFKPKAGSHAVAPEISAQNGISVTSGVSVSRN